ncbi:MAG: hypothetical protein GEU97_16945 [Actinophytocola sp.]|nr:hypothetical protein [Actinophytocola sp.]
MPNDNDDVINERLDAIELLIEEITEEVAILREALNSYAPRGNQDATPTPAEQTEEGSAHDGERPGL